MDKPQCRTLLQIKIVGKYRYTQKRELRKNIVYYLASLNYVSFGSDRDDGQAEYCQITEKGKDALYQWRQERRRWFIPVAISVFAAIGGYREELLRLLQAIGSLWKTIMGG